METSGSAREHQEAVGRQHQGRGVAEIVQRMRLGNHATAVAGDVWIHPILVHVAVKDFAPLPAAWEADAIAEAM